MGKFDSAFDDLPDAKPAAARAPAADPFDDLPTREEAAATRLAAADPSGSFVSASPPSERGWFLDTMSDRANRLAAGVARGVPGLAEIPVNTINALSRNPIARAATALGIIDEPDLLPQPEIVQRLRRAGENTAAGFDANLTPAAVEAKERLAATEGFLPTIKELLSSYGTLPDEAAEILGRMLPAAATGRIATPGRAGGTLTTQAGGTASDTAEGVRASLIERGATPEEAQAVATDVFAAMLPVGLLQKILPGGATVERVLSGAAARPGIAAGSRVLTGLAGESGAETGEEVLTKMVENIATGRPPMEGTGTAAAQGLVLGAPGGAVAGGVEALQGRSADAEAARAASEAGFGAALAEAFAGAQAAPAAAPLVADAAPVTVNPATGAPVGPIVKPRAARAEPAPAPVAPAGFFVPPPVVEPNVPQAGVSAPVAAPAPSPEVANLAAALEAFYGPTPPQAAPAAAGAPIGPAGATTAAPPVPAAAVGAPVAPQGIAALSPVLQSLGLASPSFTPPGQNVPAGAVPVQQEQTENINGEPARQPAAGRLGQGPGPGSGSGSGLGRQPAGRLDEPLTETAAARAAPTAQGAGTPPTRLAELRARGEQRTPEEAAEYTGLLERDRLQGKVRGRDMPGVLNLTAHAELEDRGELAPRQAFLDLDDFKRVNDEITHEGGDQAIAQLGDALVEAFGEGNVFHRSGDEFFVQGLDDAEIQGGLERVRERMRTAQVSVTLPDGRTVTRTGLGFSYGTGANTAEAESVAIEDKQARKAAGQRIGIRPDDERRATDARPVREGGDGAPDAGGASEGEGGREARPAAGEAVTTDAPAADEAGAESRADEGTAPPAGPDAATGADAGRAGEPPVDTGVRRTTSTKNAVVDAEREARNEHPLVRELAQTHPDLVSEAMRAMTADAGLADVVIDNLLSNGTPHFSPLNEAILLIEKTRRMNARDAAAARAADSSLTPEQRAQARVDWTEQEKAVSAIDEATRISGRAWGRFGAFRQRLMAEDYSLVAMERRAAAALGRDLEPAEVAQVARDHAAIEEKRKASEAAEAAVDAAEVDAGVKATLDAMKAEAKPPRATPKRPRLERLKQLADESREALRKARGRLSSGVDPTQFFHLARIGVYHFANGAVKFAEWAKRMKADLADVYDDVRDSLPSVFEAARKQADEQADRPATADEVVAGIEDPENITHRDVYAVARAHVLAGLTSENDVMRATHESLKALDDTLTEREVRRRFSEYGKATFPSKAEDKRRLRELRALVQLQESIDRLEDGLAPLKSGPQRDRATAEVREKRRQLNDLLKLYESKYGTDPAKLRSYQEARAANLKNQIVDLERAIAAGGRPQRKPAPEPNREVKILTEQRDALLKQLRAIERGPPPTPEQKYQRARSKAIERERAAVKERLRVGDYSRAPARVTRELDRDNERKRYELVKAKNEFARKQFEREMAQRPLLSRAFSKTVEGVNLARAVMTSFDLSAVLRQGGFIVLGHPIRAAKLLPSMLRAAFDPAFASRIEESFADPSKRQNARLYKKAGLDLPDPHNHDLSKLEEAYMSRLLEHVDTSGMPAAKKLFHGAKNITLSPVRASARAFTTFLNLLRADSFDAMVATLPMRQVPTETELKAIGGYINVATGRGKIGVKPQAAVGLNTVFFAPRLVASRFNLLFGQPLYGGSARTRALVAAEYARFATGVATVLALGAMAHDDEDEPFVILDPRHTDFLRMRFGNTYVDPMTGLSQVTVFATRVLSGEKITAKGSLQPLRAGGLPRFGDVYDGQEYDRIDKKTGGPAYGGDTTGDIIERFVRTKLAPVPGALWNLLEGEDVVGQEATIGNQAASLVTPLSLRNVFDVMKEHGADGGSAILALELLGMGVQYRDPNRNAPTQSDAARLRESLRTSTPDPP